MRRAIGATLAMMLVAACGGTAGGGASQSSASAAPGSGAAATQAAAQPAKSAAATNAAPAALAKDAACALATTDEVGAAFGTKIAKAAPSPVSGTTRDGISQYDCYYDTSDGSILGFTYSIHSKQAPITADYAAQAYGGEKVDGIADAAVWAAPMFIVRKGDRMVVLMSPTGGASPEMRAKLEAVARAVGKRM